MGIHQRWTIECDQPGCDEAIGVEDHRHEVLAMAAANGWEADRVGRRWWCPRHAPSLLVNVLEVAR